jgi:hypothetical protein
VVSLYGALSVKHKFRRTLFFPLAQSRRDLRSSFVHCGRFAISWCLSWQAYSFVICRKQWLRSKQCLTEQQRSKVAFELAWRHACDQRSFGPPCASKNQFGESFFQVRQSRKWIPILFLNGTHQESGKAHSHVTS